MLDKLVHKDTNKKTSTNKFQHLNLVRDHESETNDVEKVCDQKDKFAFSDRYLWWDLYEGGLYFMVQACVLQGVVDSHLILLCQKSEV